ncbi:MAG: Rieske 2Fe-2S domain-containing protein [Pseudomonadales bacterium]|nr:Rieske 2Fe-2S domain-containing protein [Pseudomonadales bacterium]
MSEQLITTDRQVDVSQCFNPQTGTLQRHIFTDEAIYQQELERIFARGWNFMCHESQIPAAGDFFMNWIGEDEVIVVRDREGKINVLLNSCPHRGNTVCRAEIGNTRSFFCSYHGWNFDLDGRLVGMPGEKEFYRDEIDKSVWGLSPAAKVESYRGFVFATLDPSAPALADYLGWVGRLGIDFLASKGELEFLDGVVKNRIQCNWKLAVDNLYDWYHVKVSHGTALKLGLVSDAAMAPMDQMVLLGELGHGIGGPGISEEKFQDSMRRLQAGEPASVWYDRNVADRMTGNMIEELGPVGKRSFGHPNIFPNLWVALTNQLCLRIPRGPFETELWWFTFQVNDEPEERRKFNLFMANHVFGPAGILEQDDGENWSHSTRGAKGAFGKKLPLNFAMGKGSDRMEADASGQSRIETVVNEHGQRWTYQAWQEWMQADSWETLLANHSQPPQGDC